MSDWIDEILARSLNRDFEEGREKMFFGIVADLQKLGLNRRGAVFFALFQLEFYKMDTRRFEKLAREKWGDDLNNLETIK